jgi:hypothetical protein
MERAEEKKNHTKSEFSSSQQREREKDSYLI